MNEKIKYLDDAILLSMYNSLEDYSHELKIEIIKEVKERNLLQQFRIISDSEFEFEDFYKVDNIKIQRLEKKVIKELYLNLAKLETRIPFDSNRPFFEPFSFNSSNLIDLNKVAKKISEFLHISNYTFIITPTQLDQKTAGLIEINDRKEVFIEISSDILKFQDIALATIVHEIVHQLLHIIGTNYSNILANERLTDFACVYLGFGKIMLNGLWESVNILSYKYSAGSGYLNLNEIAFILNMMHSRYGISRNTILRNIDGQKLYLILKTSTAYKFFNPFD